MSQKHTWSGDFHCDMCHHHCSYYQKVCEDLPSGFIQVYIEPGSIQ